MTAGVSTSQKQHKSRRLRTISIGSVTILSLVSLYVSLRTTLDTRPQVNGEQVFQLFVSDQPDGSTLPTFRVNEGDTVTFRIRSEIAGEATVHGYEKKVRLRPGHEVTLSFTADSTGMYPLHLHQKADASNERSELIHRHLAALEVHPR